MPAWLMDNLGTIAAGLVVIALIAAVVVIMVHNKKKGKSTCGCNCSNCPMGDSCHSAKKP